MECGEDAMMKLEVEAGRTFAVGLSVEVVAGLGIHGGAFLRGTSCGFILSHNG